ncbi:MAG: putative bifunctional diguanylate cyclase/phosphodiesterase [Sulfuricaulis sp.]
MSRSLRTLIVEDSENDAMLLVKELQRGGYEAVFARVDTRETMHAELKQKDWDIVFADFTMPRFNAFAALQLLHETDLDLPFIIVSGTIGEDRAVQAMKAGAHDYILKDNMRRLVPAVDRELREAKNRLERKQAERTIRHLAFYDSLTDLPNRTLFRNQAQQAIHDGVADGRLVALLLMDLQRFKEVNDTLGHQRGDQLLQQVGARLREAMFESDMVARLGGDEFGILLPRMATMRDIDIVARKIHSVLETPLFIEEIPIVVEASLGAAIAPEHGTDADILLQHADVAMYHAKDTGASFVLYDPARDPHSPRRLALMAELRQAIEHNQLIVHYQPKIALDTGKMIGAEALVRWQHPKDGMIPPDQFIQSAENTGLIRPLTDWVLSTGLRQCFDALSRDAMQHLAVNISVRSLHDLRFPDLVDRLLKASGIPPEKLMLEVTESAFMVDLQRTVETLAVLSHMGVMISIDDFGTGFSSLNYIKKLPINEIKIDKSFVSDMTSDENDLSIVRSIIELGHNLGLKVVAEGVENKAVLDSLAALGCDHCQGYFISHPLPHERFMAWPGLAPGKT